MSTDPSRALALEILRLVRDHGRTFYGIEVEGLDVDNHAYGGFRARIRFSIPNNPQTWNIDHALSPYHEVIRPNTARAISDELNRELDAFMRDWNRNQAQQAQENERRRREALGRADRAPTFSGGMARPSLGASTASRNQDMYDRIARDIRIQEDEHFHRQVAGLANNVATTGYVTAANNTTQWINAQPAASTVQFMPVAQQEQTYTLTPAELRTMLAEALQGLDIRISLSESDGEVTADVEVLFEGDVVASDSDSVQL